MVIRLQRILKSLCLIVHMVWLTGKFIKLRDGSNVQFWHLMKLYYKDSTKYELLMAFVCYKPDLIMGKKVYTFL